MELTGEETFLARPRLAFVGVGVTNKREASF